MKKTVTIICMLACSMCSVVLAADYIPLLEEGKEWGYVDYFQIYHPSQYIEYNRLACGQKTVINGTEYTQILQYSSCLMPEDARVIAYMREEDGKVYVRHPYEIGGSLYNYYQNDYEFERDDFVPGYGCEHLLYDFNMKVGDILELEPGFEYDPSSKEALTLKCVETGTVTLEGVTRRYLRFDRNVNLHTNIWLTYEYLVEGVGPIGNCNFTLPYRADPLSGMYTQLQQIQFLYQRKRPENTASGTPLQGEMLYRAPFFDVMGFCDPSVFYWPTKEDGNEVPVRIHKREDLNIKLRCSLSPNYDTVYHIVCEDEDIEEVVVCDVIGRQLDFFHPDSKDFIIPFGKYGQAVIVKASTANACRSVSVGI